MDSPLFWICFELGINIIENYLLLEMPTKALGRKFSGPKFTFFFLLSFALMLGYSVVDGHVLIADYEMYITTFLIFVYCLFMLEGGVGKKLAIAVLSRALTTLANALVLLIFGLTLNVSTTFFFEQNISRIVAVIIAKMVYFALTRLTIAFFRRDRTLTPWQWVTVTINFLMSLFSAVLLVDLIRHEQTLPDEQVSMLIIVLCIWASTLITDILILKMGRENEMKTELSLLKQHGENQLENIEYMKQSGDELKLMRHDMRNYLTTIGAMIELKKYTEALGECEKVAGRIGQGREYIDTGKEYINALLNNKLYLCGTLGIDVKTQINREVIDCDEISFTSVLGNLLNNAIEACEKLPEDKRHIEIEVKEMFGFTHLIIKNSTEGAVLSDGRLPQTSKPDRSLHGLGHKSVTSIMKKLNGVIDYMEKDNMFTAEALFPRNADVKK